MRTRLIKFTLFIGLLATSFLGGVIDEKQSFKGELLADLLFVTDMYHETEHNNVTVLQDIFLKYKESQREGEEYLKTMLLVNYTRLPNNDKQNIIQLLPDSRIYLTNREIESFINKYPIEVCEEEIEDNRFKCSFKKFLD